MQTEGLTWANTTEEAESEWKSGEQQFGSEIKKLSSVG
jgi:hypothetical protein